MIQMSNVNLISYIMQKLGSFFNNPLEYTQYANRPYNDFINRYDGNALNELLQKSEDNDDEILSFRINLTIKKVGIKEYCDI